MKIIPNTGDMSVYNDYFREIILRNDNFYKNTLTEIENFLVENHPDVTCFGWYLENEYKIAFYGGYEHERIHLLVVEK